MPGPAKQIFRRRSLDQSTEIHHADALRNVPHHRQIVCDEHVCQPELLLQGLLAHDSVDAEEIHRLQELIEQHQEDAKENTK